MMTILQLPREIRTDPSLDWEEVEEVSRTDPNSDSELDQYTADNLILPMTQQELRQRITLLFFKPSNRKQRKSSKMPL